MGPGHAEKITVLSGTSGQSNLITQPGASRKVGMARAGRLSSFQRAFSCRPGLPSVFLFAVPSLSGQLPSRGLPLAAGCLSSPIVDRQALFHSANTPVGGGISQRLPGQVAEW